MTSLPGPSASRLLSRVRRIVPAGARFLASLILLASVTLVAAAPLAAQAAPPSPFSGHWEGELDLPNGLGKMGIKLELHPSEPPTPWVGTMDIPAQGAEDIPLTDIRIDGTRLHFVLFTGQDNPTFEGTLADGKITGTFTQGAIVVPFWLGREHMVDPPKAQDPKPPFPYKIEEVTYTNGPVRLAGTLTTPEGRGPFPAVLLITGSGAQDRDESILGHRPFWVLADHLSRHGIAVLRVDDRGVGGSTGDTQTATSADFAQDVLAGVALLKAHAGIDPKRIGLLGHSEGGLIAPLAASQSPDVAFLVLLAAPGVPGEEIVLRQLELISRANGEGEEKIAQQVNRQKRIFDALRSMTPADAEAEIRKIITLSLQEMRPEEIRAMGGTTLVTENGLKQVTSPWFRFFATFDPRTALRQLKKPPVLALNGEKDLQVPYQQNLPEIEKALRAAGNRDVTTKSLPGLNHLFQPAATGSPAEYAQSAVTIDPSVLDLISDWIRKRLVPLPPPGKP